MKLFSIMSLMWVYIPEESYYYLVNDFIKDGYSIYVCKSEVTKVPLKYRIASKKKVAETLNKMPAPRPARKEIVV